MNDALVNLAIAISPGNRVEWLRNSDPARADIQLDPNYKGSQWGWNPEWLDAEAIGIVARAAADKIVGRLLPTVNT